MKLDLEFTSRIVVGLCEQFSGGSPWMAARTLADCFLEYQELVGNYDDEREHEYVLGLCHVFRLSFSSLLSLRGTKDTEYRLEKASANFLQADVLAQMKSMGTYDWVGLILDPDLTIGKIKGH